MEFKTIFKYRNIWMGLAIFWIMFYHAPFELPFPFDFIQRLGYGGVDIFLFASGIGCYFSYSKDLDYCTYMKRRAKRILPTFYIFLTIWVTYKLVFSNISPIEILGNFSFVGYLLDMNNQFNWYISTVWILYLALPFIYYFFNKATKLGKILAVLFLVLFSATFYSNELLLIFTCRIPVFILGCYFAHISKTKKRLDTKYIIASLVFTVIGFVWICACILRFRSLLFTVGFSWYPFLFVTPGLCISISFFADKAEKFKATSLLNKGIAKLGGISLDVYLVHIMVYDIVDDFLDYNLPIWIILALSVIIISILFSYFVKVIEKYAKVLFGNRFVKKSL